MATALAVPTKAITIRHPYAWAVAAGYKNVENRPRSTNHRGPVAIASARLWHAIGGIDPRVRAAWRAYARVILLDPHTPGAEVTGAIGQLDPDNELWLPRGVIVAVAELVDCHEATAGCCRPWGADEGWHLMLDRVEAVVPEVPCRGQQSVPWNLPPEVVAALAAGRRWGVVHVGPADGVCSVEPEGCGYCHGPCQQPRTDQDESEA